MAERAPDGERQIVASVIVPVRNHAHFLRTLIPALEAQSLPREQFEVIIADDGSTDGVLAAIADEHALLRVSRDAPRTEYAARNRAAAEARGAVLAFIDVDCIPERDWLEKGIAALDKADVVAGAIRFMVPKRRTVWTLIDIETTKNQEQLVKLGYAETANLFVRRDVFDRIGGLEDSLAAHADFDFASRVVQAGGRLVYAPDALAWHPTRDSAGPVLRFHWKANRAWAARTSREGGRPHALTFRSWVPVIPVARARRRFGSPLGLERRWLGANGVQPTLPEEIKAAPINYLLLPYLRLVAQCVGWFDGRRLRSEALSVARSADA